MKRTKNKHASRLGRFAYEGLDRVIHERARLGILSALLAHPQGLLFGDLKQLCGLTDGNLSRHLQVLLDAGLVDISKCIAEGRPQTSCKIKAQGRRRYLGYLSVLKQVIHDADTSQKHASATRHPRKIA